MSREFSAQYSFHCALCGRQHPEGTIAKYNLNDQLFSVECSIYGTRPEPTFLKDEDFVTLVDTTDVPTEAEQEYARKNRCGSCFLVHAGECF